MQFQLCYNPPMSKESTKKAFQKAFSAHMLLNLSPEEEASIRESYGLEKPTPSEPQLRSKTQPSTPTQQEDV